MCDPSVQLPVALRKFFKSYLLCSGAAGWQIQPHGTIQVCPAAVESHRIRVQFSAISCAPARTPVGVSELCAICSLLYGAVFTWGDGQLRFSAGGKLVASWGDTLLEDDGSWGLQNGVVNAQIRGMEHR